MLPFNLQLCLTVSLCLGAIDILHYQHTIMCQQEGSKVEASRYNISKRSGLVSPRMVTVLQFCALCCLHVACRPCAASHAHGHHPIHTRQHDIDIATSEWTVFDDDTTSNTTDESDADAKWVCIVCVMLLLFSLFDDSYHYH
jgi:hypothetical protein